MPVSLPPALSPATGAAVHSPPTPRTHPGWALMILVAAAAAIAYRAPGALALPQFWAEDAVIFFIEQRSLGLASLIHPYAQYLHLIPRAVAQAASLFPTAMAPAIYGITAFLISSLALGYFILSLRSSAARLMAILASFLALTNGEIYGTLTNVQWFLQLFLVSACLTPRTAIGPISARVGPVLILIASLTGPFSVITALLLVGWLLFSALPVPGNMALVLRAQLRQLSGPRVCALALGAGIQLYFLLTSNHQPPHQTLGQALTELPAIVQIHSFGIDWMPKAAVLSAIGALVLALLLPLGQAGEDRHDRILLAFTLVFGLVQTLGGMTKMGIPMDIGGGDRYLYAFKLALWSSLPLIAVRPGRWRILMLALATLLLAVTAYRNPQWLVRTSLPDLRWEQYAPALDRNEAVVIPIHPIPWEAHVPARAPAPASAPRP